MLRGPALAACFLISLTIAAPAQQSQPTVRHHRVEEPAEPTTAPEVEQAETAIQKGDFATAEPLLQKAVASAPTDSRAWFDLGYVYSALEKPDQAVDAYRKSVAGRPDIFESNLNLGLVLAKQGHNAEAAKYLKAATGLAPQAHPEESLARAWMALGKVEESTDPKQAALAYEQAAKLNSKSAEPHLAAAAFFEYTGNLDGAAREYQAAADLDPSSTDAITGLANVYIAQSNYSQAEAALRKLLTADSNNPAANYQLARVLSAQGKNDEAAQYLQASEKGSSGNGGGAFALGVLYAKAGKDSEAEQQFRLAVQQTPKDAAAHHALGALLLHEKKYDEAQRELMAAVQLKPDLADAYGELAVVAAENKQYVLALRALDDRAKYLPEVPATYFLRATTFDHLKATPQAVEYYQRFLAADDGKFPDREWQARHRLIALDPKHADKYEVKVKK